MVNVLRGKPLALLVMMASGRNSPSRRANSMCSYLLQLATSIHASQTFSGLARETLEASYETTDVANYLGAEIGPHSSDRSSRKAEVSLCMESGYLDGVQLGKVAKPLGGSVGR
jgi:hypothetical protein